MDKFSQDNNNKDNEKINNIYDKNNENECISPITNYQLKNDNFLNNNSLYKTFSNVKKYLNFSSEKNSIIKNLNFNQLLDLDTEEKKEININNDIIYNEINNNLNNIINRLQIEDLKRQNFIISKNNLYFNIKYFLNDTINFDEEKANKLKVDLEDIKQKYDYYISNINETSKLDWEILDDLIKNYNDYCLDFLKNIKNIGNLKELILLLKTNINKIMNNYFKYKKRQNNILLSNHSSKLFLNDKKKLSKITNNKNIENYNNIKTNNMIILSRDENGIFNKYIYYKYNKGDSKNIYNKNLIPKYISLSFYISKNENEDNIIQIIQNIKCIFKKYLITNKDNYDNIYIKIKFCGICSKPKIIINKIKYLMKYLLNQKSLVKIYLFGNFKESLYKIINQININNDNSNINKSLYDYYTTNINISYLKQMIFNKNY